VGDARRWLQVTEGAERIGSEWPINQSDTRCTSYKLKRCALGTTLVMGTEINLKTFPTSRHILIALKRGSFC